MAGISKGGIFQEKISPFLKNKMELLRKEYGEDSEEFNALYLQYKKTDIENVPEAENNRRHWEADVNDSETIIHGLERLYNQSLVIEPTMICAAHCRYCLRANYEIFTLSEEELLNIAKYCGKEEFHENLSEVLITGGDPLIVPKRLRYLIESIIEHAPNIRRIRIGTRLPLQDPNRIDNDVFEIFRRNKDKVRFEIATQINHSVEFFPETIEKFSLIRDLGVTIYSQNVILKGINDNINALINLYKKMRELGIEAHYLFHSVPMRGMHHFRTTVQKGLDLIKELTNSGAISGRVKPTYALMTDIGKIILYDGVINTKNDKNQILLKSSYKYEDRIKYNPNWKIPNTAFVDNNGYLSVWYLDGEE
ncbi:MAG: hypothetical protein Q8880_07650 [Bacteroidota bacterium]|nr:hypothetical protein [Bacteroidota bacterium]